VLDKHPILMRTSRERRNALLLKRRKRE
jgi:hypothetical protein